jgi:hypothetical protein
LLSALYISLSALRHKKNTDLTRPSAHLRTTAAIAMVKRPAASRMRVAPSARSAKKAGANRERPNATKIAAKPRDKATLRMDRPFSPQATRQHFRRRAQCAKMGQMA